MLPCVNNYNDQNKESFVFRSTDTLRCARDKSIETDCRWRGLFHAAIQVLCLYDGYRSYGRTPFNRNEIFVNVELNELLF